MSNLKTYVCHKEVMAAKIVKVTTGSGTTARLQFKEDETDYAEVDLEWFLKHKPMAGGYYVVYKDGYTSFSPAAAFEEGYTLKA